MARKAKIKRKTTETDIALELGLDGSGKGTLSTSIPFLDHMLNLFSRHGLFD
jgi:imidazoleglycerol-phosphate dehydratase